MAFRDHCVERWEDIFGPIVHYHCNNLIPFYYDYDNEYLEKCQDLVDAKLGELALAYDQKLRKGEECLNALQEYRKAHRIAFLVGFKVRPKIKDYFPEWYVEERKRK